MEKVASKSRRHISFAGGGGGGGGEGGAQEIRRLFLEATKRESPSTMA